MYTIITVLLVLWFLGFVARFGGDFIHGLLLVAGILFLVNLIRGRAVV